MSERPAVHLVHPGNPFSADPDGIVSVQLNFIRAAPEDFDLLYWGVRRRGVAEQGRTAGEERFSFRPVLSSASQRPFVPLSLRFAARLMRMRGRIGPGVRRFDRVESALPFLFDPDPKVVFLHTWNTRDIRNEDSESRWRRAGAIYDRLFDRVIRRMDLVYVLRPDMAEDLARRLHDGETRVRSFGVPVDLSSFAPITVSERTAVREETCADRSIPPESRLVLFAGRIEGQKRPLVLPGIAAALSGDQRETHVLVAGTGSLEATLAKAASREAPRRVHLLGSIPQDRLARLLASVDALVLPSAFEGLPNVVLEALAVGTPVVAARHGGRTAEVLGRGRAGIVCGSGPGDMAAALRTVFGWNGAGAEERRRIAEGFSPEALNRPVYEELRELARGPRPDRPVAPSSRGRVDRLAAHAGSR